MKILVTGATGFVGNHVMQQLLQSKHEIIASAMHRNLQQTWSGKVRFVAYDLYQQRENPYVFFDQPDILIHLAWDHLDNFSSDLHIQKTLPVHKAFINALIAGGLKRIVVAGTCLEYGLQEGCLAETSNSAPVISYAIAKDALRKYLEELKAQHSFEFLWLRLFYMYGKGQQEKSILQQLEKAIQAGEKSFNMSGGEQWRDYLPVETMASRIVQAALSDAKNEIVNCCSGHPVSIKELVTEYLNKAGVEMKLNLGYYAYPDYEPFRFWGNDATLKKIVGETK